MLFKEANVFFSGVYGLLLPTAIQTSAFIFRLPHELPLERTNDTHIEVHRFFK
jgi:hypothetical protein